MRIILLVGRLVIGIVCAYAGIEHSIQLAGPLSNTLSNAFLAIGLVSLSSALYGILDEISHANKRAAISDRRTKTV